MLTLAPIRTPERVIDHFAPVHRDGGATRPAATWLGKGAALEGLRNPVDPACLLPLLDGRIDETTLLGRAKGDNREHRPGLALTFSAPKNVGLVALACGYDVCWYDNDTFELAVIPRRLALLLSSRAKTVERRLGEQGLSRPTASIRQCECATRQAEAAQPPRLLDRQRQQDRHRAAQAGLDLAALVARARQRGKALPLPVSAATDDTSATPATMHATGC